MNILSSLGAFVRLISKSFGRERVSFDDLRSRQVARVPVRQQIHPGMQRESNRSIHQLPRTGVPSFGDRWVCSIWVFKIWNPSYAASAVAASSFGFSSGLESFPSFFFLALVFLVLCLRISSWLFSFSALVLDLYR